MVMGFARSTGSVLYACVRPRAINSRQVFNEVARRFRKEPDYRIEPIRRTPKNRPVLLRGRITECRRELPAALRTAAFVRH